MRKNILVVIIIFLCCFNGCSNFTSSAVKVDGETKDLFTLDNNYNMAVSILFDKENPTVSFVSPDGSLIAGTSLEHEGGEDWVQYYIPKAAKGKWKINYDKKSNSDFEISYSSYMDTSINELSFGEVKGTFLPIKFTVTSSADQKYEYIVYAVKTDDEWSTENVMAEGSADVNKATNLDVSIGDLVDSCEYKIRLDIWQQQGVEEAYDSVITDEIFTVFIQ